MVKEKPKNFYKSKPSCFGNGARLKAYKIHIGKEMVIMTKEYWDKIKKDKKVSEKESEKNNKKMAKKWVNAEDKRTDELIKDL